MPEIQMLTKRQSSILGVLQNHLSSQFKANALQELPDKIDENTGEILASGSKSLIVNEKFGQEFTEEFQNALKRAGLYVTLKVGNQTWNVIKFQAPKTMDSTINPGTKWTAPAKVILVRAKTVEDLSFESIPAEEPQVQM